MIIKKFNKWVKLNETIYLKNTILNSYKAVSYNGILNVTLDVKNVGDVFIDLEKYGVTEDKEFIIHLNDNLDDEIIKEISSSFIYVLNKNKLGYEFGITETDKESSGRTYIIMSSNKQCTIEDIERIIQTTKITNSKIKDTGDFDKLIYQTSKNKLNETIEYDKSVISYKGKTYVMVGEDYHPIEKEVLYKFDESYELPPLEIEITKWGANNHGEDDGFLIEGIVTYPKEIIDKWRGEYSNREFKKIMKAKEGKTSWYYLPDLFRIKNL